MCKKNCELYTKMCIDKFKSGRQQIIELEISTNIPLKNTVLKTTLYINLYLNNSPY